LLNLYLVISTLPINFLRHTLKLLGALSLALFLGACTPKPEYSEALEALSLQFKTANRAESIAPMLSLYHVEGCDEYTLTMLKGALIYELGLPVREVTFEPLSGAPEEAISYTYNDISYGPTLPPTYRMKVSYALDDGFTSLYTIGQTADGTWKIVSAKPLTTPAI